MISDISDLAAVATAYARPLAVFFRSFYTDTVFVLFFFLGARWGGGGVEGGG